VTSEYREYFLQVNLLLENMVVRQTIIVSKSKIYSEIFCMSSQIGTSISRIPGSLRKFVKLWHDHGFKYSIATQINKLRYKSLNKGLTESQLAVSQGITLNVHQEANSSFRYFTDFDAEMVEEMQAFIKTVPGKICLLDVGAHYGIFSLVFAKRPNTVAFALEPSSSTYKMLRYHQQANPDCNIKPFQLALGAFEGKLQMQQDGTHLVAVSTEDLIPETLLEIDVTTLDTFVQQQNIVPDVIKIDVEGFELNVLRGGAAFLSQNNPLIFLEIHPNFLNKNGDSVDELISFLFELNYKFYDSSYKLIEKPGSFLNQCIRRVICSKQPLS
jgi:FkbM family methyltransferase